MSIFKNVGHFFATAINKILTSAPTVEAKADAVNAQVQTSVIGVEAVSSVIPVYGPEAVTIEKAGAMALGAIVGIIHMFGEAAKSKLLDVGLDQTAIDTAVSVYSSLPGSIKALVTPAATAPPAA